VWDFVLGIIMGVLGLVFLVAMCLVLVAFNKKDLDHPGDFPPK